MIAGRAYAAAAFAVIALAGCEPTTTGSGVTGGTVIEAGEAKMRVSTGETVEGIAGGPLTLLLVTRADSKPTTTKDEAAARAVYAAYCQDKGGPGLGGEGYFSQFGGRSAWKFGACGA
ncbi:hypothetical protein [Paracoccus zhejiangensis]|uniref:Uncharacterized protein n=1 Tax=Paracoccus zhejiangensis TaxID=1077935 RepID=A0A2H5EU12_9RHOB|nr:hypothetical protein [Paracoccus zhejiangensis]AUH62795.1 hypothetical protein CX676_00330 [Paracoccus zhejiangensis]